MKIGVFAYNFEHKKTQETLLNLFLHGKEVSCVLAAEPVEIKSCQSRVRVAPKGLSYTHPKEIAKKLKIPFHVVKHNSQECRDVIESYDLDLGIIAGARILEEDVINGFNVGILNMHPGLLPQNRGMDNLKWAILKGFKQGVSCHLISREIDKGKLVIQREIEVFEDDTLLDIHLRIQNLEQELMIESLRVLEDGNRDFDEVAKGNYFKAVPPELEGTLLAKFEEYKSNYHHWN